MPDQPTESALRNDATPSPGEAADAAAAERKRIEELPTLGEWLESLLAEGFRPVCITVE